LAFAPASLILANHYLPLNEALWIQNLIRINILPQLPASALWQK
jgi:hypothetical protein